MKKNNLIVVGIGASAGGLDAIRNMFDTMPEDTGLAFVIVQHLSPDFKSLMPELLAKHTRIPIYTVKDNQEVKPNTIYLNQRNKNLILENKHFKLSEKEPRGQLSLPIDVFFHSLGNEYKENSVGVVLSGTGTDSSRGIKTIKEEGGTIIVQNPTTAQFDGMPNAAISTNLADYILKPEEMAGVISELPNKRFFIDTHNASQATNEKTFIDILTEIHKASAIDFRKYKRNTLLRRLEKRMAINNIESLEKYLNYIKTNKDEIKKVGQDFLIQVTSFFRDNEVFEKLQKEIIPKVIKAAEKNETIRIWVPACSSGEEAFSIAIVIDDVISSLNKFVDFKIFATDVAYSGKDSGGYGIYDVNAASEIPERYLDNYFIQSGNKIKIVKRIREKIVFSRHDIIKDPPFIRMDFISCRNLLIYFENELQKKVLTNFNYGLKKDGVLLLGKSESLGVLSSRFEILDSKYKIYRSISDNRKLPDIQMNNTGRRSFQFPGSEMPYNYPVPKHEKKRNESFYHYILSKTFSPDCLIFDDKYNVLYVKGEAGKRLSHKEGIFEQQLLQMVSDNVANIIRKAINKLNESNTGVQVKGVLIKTKEKSFTTDFHFYKYTSKDITYYVLSFGDENYFETSEEIVQAVNFGHENLEEQRIHDLEDELIESRSNLQDTVEELETSNEELQSSNEELMASNEELQSTNEELQSVNEELHSVNAELQEKNQELKRLNSDMINLFNSSNVATLFLDSDLRIRKFTPALKNLFKLTDSDYQRPINDFASNFDESTRKSIIDDSQKAISEIKAFEKELQDENGKYYLKRINPYINSDKKIDGVVITFIDITSLKKQQQLTDESEARYKELFENVNEPFVRGRIIKNDDDNPVDWEFISVNPAFEAHLGAHQSGIKGKKISEVLKAEEYAEWLDRFVYTAETGKKQTITDYAPPLKGFFAINIFSPAKNEFAAIYTDLTQIRKTQETLRFANNRFELAADITGLALWEWNLKSDSAAGNKMWETLFGLDSKNIFAQISENIRGNHRSDLITKINHHIQGNNEKLTLDFKYYNPVNGKYYWINMVSKILQKDNHEKPEKLICAALDITEQTQTIIKLQKEKLFNQRLSESVPSGIYTYDLEQRKVTFVNEYFTKITGYTGEELNVLETTHLQHYCHPDDYKRLEKHFFNVVRKKKQFSTEFRFKSKNGRWVWCMALHSPLERDPEENVISLVGVIIDISQRKKLDAQLISAKKRAETANMHKNIFLANMSHEIRTPMNSVIGFSRLLKKDGHDDTNRNKYLDIIDKSSTQLLGLIDDIIDVAKMEAGELSISKSPFNLEEMLETLKLEFEQKIKDLKKDEVSLILSQPEESLDNMVESDERRLKQVLTNLIGNAIKFTQKGKIEFGYNFDKRNLHFYVTDEGIGIPQRKQKEIFESFKQVNYDTAEFGGTGLGLAISKGIVDLLGGSIKVKSKVNQGTTFNFSIPLEVKKQVHTHGDAALETKSASNGQNLSGRKILIAEDDEFIRFHYQMLFKDSGAKLEFAKNGKEAVDLFHNQSGFDLVLMDIRMPEKNGYEAMKEILQSKPDTVVFMQSAFAMQEEINKCFEAGCKGYFTKPVEEEKLFKTIKKWLN